MSEKPFEFRKGEYVRDARGRLGVIADVWRGVIGEENVRVEYGRGQASGPCHEMGQPCHMGITRATGLSRIDDTATEPPLVDRAGAAGGGRAGGVRVLGRHGE